MSIALVTKNTTDYCVLTTRISEDTSDRWFAAWGEVGAGIGLLIGGLMMYSWWSWIGDLLTRFSGFVIGCIMTGVIWVGQPDSFMDVILYDNLHVLLWVGGLYFALRGHKT